MGNDIFISYAGVPSDSLSRESNLHSGYDVFISFSTKDQAIALDIFRELESTGLRCWMSKSRIISGTRWADEIASALEHSRTLVCVLSQSSADSVWVQREVADAQDNNVPVIPYVIGKVNLPGELRLRLKSVQWIESLELPMERLPDLIADIRSHLPISVLPNPSPSAISPTSGLSFVGNCPICNDEHYAVLVAGQPTWFECKNCKRTPICRLHRDTQRYVCCECAEANEQGMDFSADNELSSRPLVGASSTTTLVDVSSQLVAIVRQTGDKLNHFIDRPPTIAKLGDSWIHPTTGIELVFIPPGDFFMGDDDIVDNQRHTVKLSGYWISRTLVTVDQYLKYCTDTGVIKPDAPSFNFNWFKRDHPIVNVSFNDVQNYCKWSGLQLPTEAQWEKAARGTDGRKYPWGDNFDTSKLRCIQSRGGDVKSTAPAKQFKQGIYDLYDMAGNVWQWCRDDYVMDFWNFGHYSEIDPVNIGYDSGGRVLRGGSWTVSNPDFFRSAYRFGLASSWNKRDAYGFRVVAEL